MERERKFTAHELADYIANAKYEDFPEAVVRKAKSSILDSVGCALGGSKTSIGKIILSLMRDLQGPGSVIVGSELRALPTYAAYANASLVNILDWDDTLGGIGHPGATIIPAALAVGEAVGASGKDIITAVVLGYEVSIRIGSAIQPTKERMRHVWAFGTWHTFGTVTAVGKILGLKNDEIVNALGIAGANAPVPSIEKTVLGALGASNMVKNNYGCATETGVLAAMLARRGFKGPHDILDGDDGFWIMAGSDQCDFAKMTDALGKKYCLLDLSYKPYPSCRWSHSIIDAARSITQNRIAVEDIEDVVIKTWAMNTTMPYKNPQPMSMYEAQFSNAYIAALALSGVEPGTDWYSEERLADPKVLALARKVRLQADDEAEKAFPSRMMVKMEVTARGSRFSSRIESPKGEPDNPITEADLTNKFRGIASKAISPSKVEELIGVIQELEELKDIGNLAKLCVP